ncbi:MAG TPA: hypothetical protein VFS30_03020 [Dehalococcoidia bacterium]|nr:hypothetical protein [Dehalococcoidia bacterium]
MIGFKTRQGSHDNPPNSIAPVSLWKQGTQALQRYLLISTGISSTALGLALIVSFFAATHGESAAQRTVLTASDVELSQIKGRLRTTALESTRQIVSPELVPSTAIFPVAAPAPPLDVERRQVEETRASNLDLHFAEPSFPLPPATQLDAVEAPQPLDMFAAALPLPLLAQTPIAEELPEPLIAPPGGLPTEGEIFRVDVTFYDCLDQGFCGAMYNGEPVYEGAAACSWDLPLGTRFAIDNDPTRRIYVCADRGLLPDTWVDIYFYSPQDGWDWQRSVGRHATVHILSVPFDPLS